jgi:hypothetical protein
MNKVYISLLVLLVPIFLFSQDSSTVDTKTPSHTFLSLNYHAGQVLQTNDFLKGENASGKPVDYFQAIRLEYGKQTTGEAIWEQWYNYPIYGIGFYGVDFFNEDELGQPSAIYGFFNGFFKRWERWRFGYEIGFGLTYNWKPFDHDANPHNIAIGSYNTVYIDAGLTLKYLISKRFDLDLGFSFTHFSNGATAVPNFGINLLAPRLGLTYQFQAERPVYIVSEIPDYESEYEWLLSLGLGSKQVEFDTAQTGLSSRYLGVSYGLVVLTSTWLKQFSYSSKAGLGLDLSYDGSTNAQIEVNDETIDKKARPHPRTKNLVSNITFLITGSSV